MADNNLLPNQFLYTSYYTNINTGTSLDVRQISLPDYDPNDIFCLRTRLQPHINELISRKAYIALSNYVKGEKSFVVIVLYIGSKILSISNKNKVKLEEIIDKITSEYPKFALLYSVSNKTHLTDEFGNIIPVSWINSILRFIKINRNLRPFFKDQEGIYISTANINELKKNFGKLQIFITDKIKEMYSEGYILEPDRQLVENWNLVRISPELQTDMELYRATWKDPRITSGSGGLTKFLLNRYTGNKRMIIRVENSLQVRHSISIALSEVEMIPKFSGSNLYIDVENLDEAKTLVSIIKEAECEHTINDILIINSNRISWSLIYKAIIEKTISVKNLSELVCTIYQTDDVFNPVTFSCELSSLLFDILKDNNISSIRQDILDSSLSSLENLELQLSEVLHNYDEEDRRYVSIHKAIEDSLIEI